MPEPKLTDSNPGERHGASGNSAFASEDSTATSVLTAGVPAEAASTGKPRSLWSDAWRDLRRNPIFLLSAVLIAFLLVVAIVPQLLTGTDPTFCELKHSNAGAAAGHPFGYDRQGCDLYSRVIYGARASVTVGILVTLSVVIIGGSLGAIAGFYGGWLDSLLSRVTDVFFAIPSLLAFIVFLTAFPERSIWTVILAIVVFGWPQVARIMRGAVISVREADFVVAARALGASSSRILLRHIVPNALAPVIVVASISLGLFIVAEASLSYLGIGLPPETVSWGNDISAAQASLRAAPRVLMWPAAALSLTVLAFMLLGDAVRDALDPKTR